MVWGEEQKEAFKESKRVLTNAPALGLQDMMKPVFLYVRERLGTDVGVLTQLLGSWNHPVAYLSKQLDPVSQGWPPSLSALVATAILVAKADKVTLGQELTVSVPHSVLKHGQEILEMLEAVWAPKRALVMHCRGHQKERQQVFGETEKLRGKPNEQISQEDKLPTSLTAALFRALYLNGTYSTLHKNRLGLRLKEKFFYWSGGKNLLVAVLFS
jgi:hypothetical protein